MKTKEGSTWINPPGHGLDIHSDNENSGLCRQCNGVHTLFFQDFPSGEVTTLVVYVDDIVVSGSSNQEAIKLENHLSKHFEKFLGIEKARSSDGILMTLEKYKLYLLSETKQRQCQTNHTSAEVNHKLTFREEDPRI